MLHDHAHSAACAAAQFGQHPIEIDTAAAYWCSDNGKSHAGIDAPNVVVLGMKHDRVLGQVLDHGAKGFGAAEGIGGVKADADMRTRNAGDDPGELQRAKGFVVLESERHAVPLQRGHDLPDCVLSCGQLFRPQHGPGQNRAQDADSNSMRDGDVLREMLRIEAARASFEH